MIELRNVSLTLRSEGNEFRIKNVDMMLKEEKAVIIGPNGSGKTTLIKAIAGLIPYDGEIFIDGMELRKIRGFLEFSTNLPEAYKIAISVKDILKLLVGLKGVDEEVFYDFLKRLNINPQELIRKPLHSLSAGQSVIVRTALALSSKPKIILLDEPFENVDPARRLIIVEMIREYGKEGLIATHELDILKKVPNYKAYIMIEGALYGPVKVEDLLNSSIVEGEQKEAILTIEVLKRKYSIIKERGGIKFGELGSLNRLYGVL